MTIENPLATAATPNKIPKRDVEIQNGTDSRTPIQQLVKKPFSFEGRSCITVDTGSIQTVTSSGWLEI